VNVQLYTSLILVVDEDELLVSHPGCFTAGELASNSDWTRSWVGSTFSLDTAVLAIKCAKFLQILFPRTLLL